MLVNDSVKMYPNINLYSKKSIYSPIGEELVSVGEHHHDSYSSFISQDQAGRRLVASTLTSQKSMSPDAETKVAGEVGTYTNDGTVTSVSGYRMSDTSKLDNLLEENDIPSRILSDPELLADITEEFIAKNNSVQLLGHELRKNQVSGDLNTNKNLRILTTDSTSYDRNLCGLSIDTFRNWLLSSYTISSNVTQSLSTVITDIETSSVFTIKFTKASQIAIVKNTNAMGSGIVLRIPVYVGDRHIQEISILPKHTVKIVSIIEENDVRKIFYESNSVLERLYPIGSYYWSANSWNPSQMFGGTWVQPAETQGRFLYAINSNNSNININGGEPTHTLSVSEIPNHTHYQGHAHNFTKFYDNGNPDSWSWRGDPVARYDYKDDNSGAGKDVLRAGTGRNYGLMYRSYYGTNKMWNYFSNISTYSGNFYCVSAGSSYPHENMPPYIVAYLWRRTA